MRTISFSLVLGCLFFSSVGIVTAAELTPVLVVAVGLFSLLSTGITFFMGNLWHSV